jgi:carbon storage regulator
MTISYGRPSTIKSREPMLVLMRRPGESIHIGPDIVVTLVTLERNRARIGIEAPRDVIIDREEVALKKRLEILTDLDDARDKDDSEGGGDDKPPTE